MEKPGIARLFLCAPHPGFGTAALESLPNAEEKHMHRTPQAQATAISEINVTPLIDVMLCLLIIFMIAMPTLSQSVPLDLPQRGPKPEQVDPEPPMQVRILADGRLFLDQQPISADVLAAELAYQAKRDPQRVVAIDAHQDTHYDKVVAVLADVRNQGMTRIAMKNVAGGDR
jgi:biopolymer transport protein ExbD